MSTVSNPKESGQEENPIVELLGKHTKMLVRIGAAMKKLSERLDALEGDDEEDDEPLTEREPEEPSEPPPLAVLSDGRVAMHLRCLDGYDVQAREEWTGVILNEAEISDALEDVDDAAEAAAAKIARRLIDRSKKAASKPEDEPEGGEES